MSSTNINISDLMKIPEPEFKQHFRNWMEQDDVARSLQAKLRKDLIANFNKTTLGKKIIAQGSVLHRLTLSPLILALNTLVAEFLYAQNCHYTLSVFCTEVPYHDTLPDFESARHFRFSEEEIFEIFDALCSNWGKQTKSDICEEYSKENVSLLLVVLRHLLSKPQKNASTEKVVCPPDTAPEPPQQAEKPQKLDSKVECQNNNFRYLNKYLIILSKKVKEMSQNMELMQKQKTTARPAERKSLQARKFENLNKSLEKISENLRYMSLSKRKNKRLTAVVTSVDNMSKQFERCALNFEKISKGLADGRGTKVEKSYSDWIKEMRSTNNGKKFLEKVELSLHKWLQQEKEKMEREFDERLLIQKDILKTKYRQKLTEELAKYTSRSKAEDIQNPNESFEIKLKEFETKHQELHQRIHEAEQRVRNEPIDKANKTFRRIDNKGTQTSVKTIEAPPVNAQDQLQQLVMSISEQDRQVDHIVFDAKLRIQELEHESNQLDRSFRDYLDRQRSEKQKTREHAASIWQSYALGKSMHDKKCSTFRAKARTMAKQPGIETVTDVAVAIDATPSVPTIKIDSTPGKPLAFENPFREAQRKVLGRSKTLPSLPPPTLIDIEASVEKCTPRRQRPSVLRLIEHNDDDGSRQKHTSSLVPGRMPNKAKLITLPSPDLSIKDITLDGIEISGDSNGSSSSARGVFKLKRQLFTATDNARPSSSSNGQQMNSNGGKETEEQPLMQVNKENVGDKRKSLDSDKNDVPMDKGHKDDGKGNFKEFFEAASNADKLDAPLAGGLDEDVSSQSFRLEVSTAMAEGVSENDFWA